ncbi:GerAB/ArcD/ProY family transporter [Marinisporobacter balticus]|uniref:Spore germination protein KB n=1 Tax=Marinisporobacter balticus TaxID=2018667 RepID=A0A4R2KP82_9FIRM|nr:endospore germination permease [Marinisporobacter balticus]TCO74417.1 spore germination protein KB [Marinisporobacter balticus]
MNKEAISDKQGISLIVLFIIGSSSIAVSGLDAKKDVWLAIIMAMLLAMFILLIYARLQFIYPNKDLFEIIEICFGKFIGKGMIILYTCFFLDLTANVLRNYGEFINIVSFHNTPLVIPMLCIIILCAYAIKQGIEILGRWGSFFIIIPIVSLLIVVSLLISKMHINNILPVLNNGIKPVFRGAFGVFCFPFTQILPFTVAFSTFKTKRSPYIVYMLGLFIGGIVIFVTSLTDILVIGINDASSLYFATYTAVSRIDIGNILQRVEALSAIIFILGGFVKISIYLLSTCKGISKIFECTDYRLIVIPISLLVINLSYLSFDSSMQYYEFDADIFSYYIFPFQVILPIIILIVAEIKKKYNCIKV